MSNGFKLQEWAKGYSKELTTPITYSTKQSAQPQQTKQFSQSELIELIKDTIDRAKEYTESGDLVKAKQCYLEVAQIYREQLGADSVGSLWALNFAASLTCLGGAYDKLLEWQESKQCYAGTVKLCRKLGIDSSDSSLFKLALTNLGNAHHQSHEWEQAKQYLTEVVELYRKLAVDYTSIQLADNNFVRVLVTLGLTHYYLGEWQKSEQYYVDAVAIYRTLDAHSDDSSLVGEFASTLINLSAVYLKLEEQKKAKQYLSDVVELYRNLGADSVNSPLVSDFATALANLGYTHNELYESEPAKQYLAESMELLRKLGANCADSPLANNFAGTLLNLGNAHYQLLEWQQSKQCYADAMELYRKLGADSTESQQVNYFALALMNLGNTYHKLREWKKATQYLTDAMELYRNLGLDSADYITRVLAELGDAHCKLQEWQKSKKYYTEAMELYIKLEAKSVDSPLASDFAKMLNNFGKTLTESSNGCLLNDSPELKKAEQYLNEAEKIYRNLGADSVDSPLAGDFATALVNLGVIYSQLNELKKAKSYYTNAVKLYRKLATVFADSPSDSGFISSLTNLGQVNCLLGEWKEAKECFEEVIKVFEQPTLYPNDFIKILEMLSLGFQNLSMVSEIAISQPARELIKLALEGLKLQAPDSEAFNNDWNYWQMPINDAADELIQLEPTYQAVSENLTGFWQNWLDCALDNSDGEFLLDIIDVLHARRLQVLLNLNIKLTGVLDDDQRQCVKLEKRQGQIALQKSTVELTLKNVTDEDADKKQHYGQLLEQLSEQARQIHVEWLSVYHKLIEQGRYFNTDTVQMRSDQLHEHGLHFDTDAIQTRSRELCEQLAPDQAVVISVNLADYGLAEQPPRLLLIRRESISWLLLDIPDINLAVDMLTGINRAMNSGKNRLTLRTSEDRKPEQAVTSESDIKSLQQSMKETMTGCWQKLSEQLQGYTQISFIGHGHLVGLPWQGYAPPQFEVSYYSGLYAYHQRKNTHASRLALVPTAASPLTLLAYAAEDQPEKRLYHLPAEIAAIEQIWGEKCVNHLNNLSEAKPHHNLLLLLGHGNYGDGLAQFLLKNQMLEQHDLMNYPHMLRFLGASACLLGSEKDIGGEPLGLLSLCGCRPDMAFSYGSLLPVDDLSAVCLSILFHCHWKKCSDPKAAIKQALSELASGQWDESAKTVFRDVFTTHLPVMFMAIANAEEQVIEQYRNSDYVDDIKNRHDGIRNDWGVCSTKQIIAKKLADDFLEKVTTDSQWLSRLATFTSFWMYS